MHHPASRRLSAPSSTAPTFAEIAEKVISIALVRERRIPDVPTKSEERWRNAIFNHAFALTHLPVSELGTEDVLSVLEPIWTLIPQGARKTREHLYRVFAYAIARGHHPGPNPARWEGHLDQLLRRAAPPSKPHAALHHADAPCFLKDLRARRGVGASALEFVLFTGARTGEVRLATWREIDWENNLWFIPRENTKEKLSLEKLGRLHKRIPLARPVVLLLEKLRTAESRVADPIFSVNGRSPMSMNTMLGVLEDMGMKGVTTTHGLRSTFRDWVAEQRIRLPTGRLVPAYSQAAAEISLGHNSASLAERAYHRSDHLEERRDIAADWARYLLAEDPAAH